MNLDRQQKEEFISYWGQCPLVDTRDNTIITPTHCEPRPNNIFSITGHKWKPELKPDGSYLISRDGNYLLQAETFYDEGTDPFQYYTGLFIDSGFYQVWNKEAIYLSRKPDRSRIKGMSRSNTGFITVCPVTDDMKEIFIDQRNYDTKEICKIYYGLLHNYKGNIKEKLTEFSLKKRQRMDEEFIPREGYTIALSKNVALVSHLTYEIPVVLYKLNPIGYFVDNTVFINKKKDVTKQTIEEETGFYTEIYTD